MGIFSGVSEFFSGAGDKAAAVVDTASKASGGVTDVGGKVAAAATNVKEGVTNSVTEIADKTKEIGTKASEAGAYVGGKIDLKGVTAVAGADITGGAIKTLNKVGTTTNVALDNASNVKITGGVGDDNVVLSGNNNTVKLGAGSNNVILQDPVGSAQATITDRKWETEPNANGGAHVKLTRTTNVLYNQYGGHNTGNKIIANPQGNTNVVVSDSTEKLTVNGGDNTAIHYASPNKAKLTVHPEKHGGGYRVDINRTTPYAQQEEYNLLRAVPAKDGVAPRFLYTGADGKEVEIPADVIKNATAGYSVVVNAKGAYSTTEVVDFGRGASGQLPSQNPGAVVASNVEKTR